MPNSLERVAEPRQLKASGACVEPLLERLHKLVLRFAFFIRPNESHQSASLITRQYTHAKLWFLLTAVQRIP